MTTLLAAQTVYDWLLFLHVLAAMVWVGGGVMLDALAGRVLRDPDPGAVARFTGSLRLLGPLVLAPATLAVLGLGIWLVVDSEAWDFGQLWVQLGLGLFAGAFLIGAAFQSRTALAATRAAERGDDAEARRQLRRWLWGYRLIVLLLVAAAWDMTTNPASERTAHGRRTEGPAPRRRKRRPRRCRLPRRRRAAAAA